MLCVVFCLVFVAWCLLFGVCCVLCAGVVVCCVMFVANWCLLVVCHPFNVVLCVR